MYIYEYQQHKRNSFSHVGYRWFYLRRLIIILGSIILVYLFVHLIQTGLFLLEHFSETEETNDLIKLDMNIWQKNERVNRKIPRYIHQIWISSFAHQQMPEKFRKAADTCIQFHSNYNYTLWTHKNLRRWLQMEYPWFLSIYENYCYDMQRIDAMKYFLLFHFGGIYLDLDVQCNAKDLLTAMIPQNQIEYEPDVIFHMGGEGISANTDLVAAKQLHPFFKLAINRLKASNRWFYLYHLTIILSAGPTFLYGIYRQYPLKENFYFVPNDLLYGKLVEGVGGATWYGKDSLVLIFLMEYKIFFAFLLVSLILVVLYLFRILKRKQY